MMDYKKVTQEAYNATAAEFAANVEKLLPLESIKSMMSKLSPRPQILDIGCGPGRDAKIFSELGASVTGIDFCENMLTLAKHKAPTAQFLLMDMENMTFADGSFDAAWAACSLMHVPKNKLPHVLTKIHRILKKDGYFYLALKQGTGESLQKDTRYEGEIQKFWSFYQKDELSKMLLDAKFTILDFTLVKKTHEYQTHDAFRIFCQKA